MHSPTRSSLLVLARRWLGRVVPALFVLVGSGHAMAAKIAVVPLRPDAGVNDKLAVTLGEAIVAEVRKNPNADVITKNEINAILDLEQQKLLLGCSETNCLAELGGALGVDELLTGSVSQVGKSWLLHLQRVDVHSVKVVAKADRRLKDASVDDLLDALPAVTAELMSGLKPNAAPATAPITAGVPVGEQKSLPPNAIDEPLKDNAEAKDLSLFSDNNGGFVALNLTLANKSAVFVGKGERLYKQVVVSAGRSGEQQFSLAVWEPRHADGAQRILNYRNGKIERTCGETTIELTPVAKAEAAALLKKAKLLEPHWRRRALLFASDADGQYFVVDQAYTPEKREAQDLRVYIGAKGAFRVLAVRERRMEDNVEAFDTEAGTLSFEQKGDKVKALWTAGGKKTKLNALSLYQHGKKLYQDLGVYPDTRLGTLCDPVLP